MVGWKLVFLVVLAALVWRFRGLLWVKLQQLLSPPVPTASAAPVATIVHPIPAESAAKSPLMVAQLK
jgi:hypothetical protein